MTTITDKTIQSAICSAWDSKAAESNMERWLSLGEQQDWADSPDNCTLLTQLFGASWYFTRFVFFRGRDILDYFDRASRPELSMQGILAKLHEIPRTDDLEQEFEYLRINKNLVMLQIFLGSLRDDLDQQQQELALTNLAEATLHTTLDLLIGETVDSAAELSILAMGRMAGQEMNYGSDLDLIFLYDKASGQEQNDLIRKIQSLLRHIALPSAHGVLYEIDMRLRPHGTSGTLISPASYFIEYHQSEREIWERQMMTRCRPVLDQSGLATGSLQTIEPFIYGTFDEEHLRREIIAMRKRVQKELGNPKGKIEIKRGVGGIMDIDFLTHFLQLKYGHEHAKLKTSSTRHALQEAAELGLITGEQKDSLLKAYNYLKRIESALRVMDMKSISAFSSNVE
ncbi:MAG TPA: hypothetical protein VJ981_06720, partial [Gammaproteobacteria bacterium]|nr:hypothetical protein [Gammaproteobacteria bacterium]